MRLLAPYRVSSGKAGNFLNPVLASNPDSTQLLVQPAAISQPGTDVLAVHQGLGTGDHQYTRVALLCLPSLWEKDT